MKLRLKYPNTFICSANNFLVFFSWSRTNIYSNGIWLSAALMNRQRQQQQHHQHITTTNNYINYYKSTIDHSMVEVLFYCDLCEITITSINGTGTNKWVFSSCPDIDHWSTLILFITLFHGIPKWQWHERHGIILNAALSAFLSVNGDI